mgnify:CR=1 FL=1
MAADFDAPTERMESITPLLYQSGYVTIKGYDEMFQNLYVGHPECGSKDRFDAQSHTLLCDT